MKPTSERVALVANRWSRGSLSDGCGDGRVEGTEEPVALSPIDYHSNKRR